MNYGLPYKGSKNKIAPWIVEHLPVADTLLDLFAGGGAVTHCAVLQDRYKSYIMNDLNDGPLVFLRAVRGEYNNYYPIVDREEFKNTDDFFVKICYSFGNNCEDYLWSKELEPIKLSASKMLTLPTVKERRKEYLRFIKLLRVFLANDDNNKHKQGLQNLERIDRINNISSSLCSAPSNLSRIERIQALKMDYRDVDIPDNCTIYCDIPYKGTNFRKLSCGFDYEAYYKWLHSVGHLIITSEYTCPEGCIEIAARKRNVTSAATTNRIWSTEKLFVQKEFYDEYMEMMNETT